MCINHNVFVIYMNSGGSFSCCSDAKIWMKTRYESMCVASCTSAHIKRNQEFTTWTCKDLKATQKHYCSIYIKCWLEGSSWQQTMGVSRMSQGTVIFSGRIDVYMIISTSILKENKFTMLLVTFPQETNQVRGGNLNLARNMIKAADCWSIINEAMMNSRLQEAP